MVNTDFTNFGVNKIIIITALIDGYQYNFHPNTILTNNTTFEEYYSPFSLLPSPLRARVGAGSPLDSVAESGGAGIKSCGAAAVK